MEYRPEGRGHRGRVLGLRDLVEALWQCSSRVNAEQGRTGSGLRSGSVKLRTRKRCHFWEGHYQEKVTDGMEAKVAGHQVVLRPLRCRVLCVVLHLGNS